MTLNRTKSLTEIFQESAARAQEAFPERLEKLVILTTQRDRPIFVSPDIADHLAKNVRLIKGLVEERTEMIKKRGAAAIVNDDYPFANQKLKVVTLNEHLLPVSPSPKYTSQMYLTVNFDHEMGHLVVKEGDPACISPHIAECAADAYAALRHVQRYGNDTDFFTSYNRSYNIVLGNSPDHYTDAVLQKVRQLCQERDISKLSLRETAQLAGKLAVEYGFNEEKLDKVKSAFQAVAQIFREAVKKGERVDQDKILKKVLEITQTHKNDPDICAAGNQYINSPYIRNYLREKSAALKAQGPKTL